MKLVTSNQKIETNKRSIHKARDLVTNSYFLVAATGGRCG